MTEKWEKPLHLDLDPDEAMTRLLQTNPTELNRRLDRKKAPPKRGQGVDGRGRPKPSPDD